jgi:hypothetical protein
LPAAKPGAHRRASLAKLSEQAATEIEQPELGHARLTGPYLANQRRKTMRNKVTAMCSGLILLVGLSVYSALHAQSRGMAIHEPHMSAAYGHLQQAKDELEKAAPNKGGHREKAMQMVDQAMRQIEEGEQYYQQHR